MLLATAHDKDISTQMPIHQTLMQLTITTVKPVCNDHLYNKMCHLWFIQ